ncbi:TolB family protein [Solitalea koreensis]|uniref:WD40-like Beta Propeller Repeat n=1 Tax=Solitalea koreensis TaxID=543615 RepID=A0A521D917_9SPHI|nr:hypothetical protein [Solitalea koreensis]SMO68115.1 hypothetical protein SAMN06265350_10674 [Solitalea koreensis]
MRQLQTQKLLLIRILILIISTLSLTTAKAQVFNFGQNPPSIKWQQIDTKNYKVLFPSDFEKEAQRVASVLEHLYNYEKKSLPTHPRKITIILQNRPVESNGFVTLAPRHSEFYATPPQDMEPTDWLNSLAIHELRHVVQIDKTSEGINIPLIEQIQFAVFGTVFPIWFIEGDAVITETVLSNSGRGRLPNWEKEYRANTLSGENYSYSKYYLGSMKDNIPDYYRLGYFMTTKLRRDAGDTIYNAIFCRAKNKPYIPWPFSNAVNHFTGMSTQQLYKATIADLKGRWQNQLEKLSCDSVHSINKRINNVPTDYFLPKPSGNGSIICIKKGLGDVSAFVQIDPNGKEKRLFKIGLQLSPNFDLKNDVLVWDEEHFDPRFQYQTYSVLLSYNLKTKEYKQLSNHSRLFSPTLSYDGKTIACVNIDHANNFSILLIDSQTGQHLDSIANPENYILQTPSFNKTGDALVASVSSNNGRSFIRYDLKTRNSTLLMPFSFKESQRPCFVGNKILFSSVYNGIDNIYLFDPSNNDLKQVTNVGFGAYNPTYVDSSEQLFFNNFNKKGLDIASSKLNENALKRTDIRKNNFIDFSAPLVSRESGHSVLDTIPLSTHPTKKYNEWSHLFNFHSISPWISRGNDDNLIAGLRLQSNNLLNTMSLYTGYDYDQSVNAGQYSVGLEFKKYFPVFSFSLLNRERSGLIQSSATTYIPINFRENKIELGVLVPFLFTNRNYVYNTGMGLSTTYTSRYNVINEPKNFVSTIRFPLTTSYYFNRNSLRSVRDFAPHWGQNIAVAYKFLPDNNDYSGNIFTFESSFFFPGLAKHHSFITSFNYEHGAGIYRNEIDIPEASGAGSFLRTEPLKNSLLIRYRLPLFYPDWELGRFAYIKRVRGGLFTDYENITSLRDVTSYGLELRADCNLLRYYLPVFDIGTKMIFINDNRYKSPIFELILNFSL